MRQALAAGHEVTAVVRDLRRLVVEPGPGLDVVVGDIRLPESIRPAVAGRDAVVSALGPRERGPSTVCADGARSSIAAMHDAGVKRLVVVSVAGIHTEGDGPVMRGVVKPLLGRILRHPFADAQAMEDAVQASGLDWTIVNPPRLTDGKRIGQLHARVDRTVPGRGSISRADLACAVLRAVDDETLIGHRWFVATGRF